MKSVTVSSPSKLHLSGEHAVVYGKPAVLVATNKRLSVTLSHQLPVSNRQTIYSSNSTLSNEKLSKTSSHPRLRQVPDGTWLRRDSNNNLLEIRKSDKYIDHICKIFEQKYKLVIGHLSLDIYSDVPIGKGMGSSAALAAALIGALSQFYKKPWNISLINELAYKAEKFIHVNASGGDTSISCMGGLLWFRREFEFLKTFWSLPFKFPVKWQDFVLIDTGRSESTGDLVKLVNQNYIFRRKFIPSLPKDSGSNFYENVFNEIEKTTKQMVLSIKLNNEKLFMQTISQNQMLLEKIGVVSKNVKKLVRLIEQKGGVAKISGAGGIKTGSGIIIGYHQKPDIIKQIAKEFGYNTFQVKLGGEGVKIERQIS